MVLWLIELDQRLARMLTIPYELRKFLFIVEWSIHGFPWLLTAFLGVLFSLCCKWADEVQHSFVLLAIGLLLDLAVVGALKVTFQRDRPSGNIEDQIYEAPYADKYSFPSGHSSRAAMLAVMSYHLWGSFHGISILTACFVALSRITMGRHFVSDVIFGLILGCVEGSITSMIPFTFTKWIRRFFV